MGGRYACCSPLLAPLIDARYKDIQGVIGADCTHLLQDKLDAVITRLNEGHEGGVGEGD